MTTSYDKKIIAAKRANGTYHHNLSLDTRTYCKNQGYQQALIQVHKQQYMAHIRKNMHQFDELEYEADEEDYNGHMVAPCWSVTISPPEMPEHEFVILANAYRTKMSRKCAYLQYLFLQLEKSDSGRLHMHGHLIMKKNTGRYASEIERDLKRKWGGPAQIKCDPIYHRDELKGWMEYIKPIVISGFCGITVGTDLDYIKNIEKQEKERVKTEKILSKSKVTVPSPCVVKVTARKRPVRIEFHEAVKPSPENLLE